jgi:cholesterol oxidase
MTEPQTAWLSEGLEVLLAQCAANPGEKAAHFDVLIIGSGYGGAVAAAGLAGATKRGTGEALRVAVLERGREYLPGMFPSGLSTLAGYARGSTPLGDKVVGNRDGLFDVRMGGDISAIVASGLGGGSLINAGVMEEPVPSVFDHRWPQELHKGVALAPFYEDVKQRLGVQHGAQRNTIELYKGLQPNPPDKLTALKKLSGKGFKPAAITVAMESVPNQSQVQMTSCNFCGDCATGCNFGAKNSLDVNLLVEANRGNVRIITGATVMAVLRTENVWTVEVIHTLPRLARREHTPLPDDTGRLRGALLTADRVILAAGTLGSTEILLRSRQRGLHLSRRLGERFSGNGDMIAFGPGQHQRVNAVASENDPPDARGIGPTITGILDLRDTPRDDIPAMVIEELAVPAALRRVFEEVVTTAGCLQDFDIADTSKHEAGHPKLDPLAVDPRSIMNSSIYAAMGDDGAGGTIQLRGDFDRNSDGAVSVSWPGLAQHPLFPAQINELQKLVEQSRTGGRVIANPLWRPLPSSMEFLIGRQKGPLLTAHPLGGCAMGDDVRVGVVNHIGQVFTGNRSDATEVHPGLVVLDGSIIPSALGINPALTIAAVAARSIAALIGQWNLVVPTVQVPAPVEQRPIYRSIPELDSLTPTTMQFVERMRGKVALETGTGVEEFQAEITLYFADKKLSELYAHSESEHTGNRAVPRREQQTLNVADSASRVSRLRLFHQADWQAVCESGLSGRLLEERLDELSVFTAPLGGKLVIMGRGPTSLSRRLWSAFNAWWRNRGLRDIWQSIAKREHEKQIATKPELPDVAGWRKLCLWLLYQLRKLGAGIKSLWQRIVSLYKALTRAGEVRLFEYELAVQSPTVNAIALDTHTGKRICGSKRISYLYRGNPLDQLSQMTLSEFPGRVQRRGAGVLTLVPEFLARSGLPLFRIMRQQDCPQAMMDLVSLGAYFLRLLLSIHLYTLRKPDTARPRVTQRLPGNLPGLPRMERQEIVIEHDINNTPETVGSILLSRYRGKSANSLPVLLIHGYSASGTTFAHPALQLDLTRHLWARGRDVWVLDLRSSAGSKTATVNYSFEQLAATDIPIAVAHVCKATGKPAIDIVAHCMGAAMLSMAILNPASTVAGSHYRSEREQLPGRIRRLVLSQVGPLVSMAPANIFRAYLFSYLKQWLPLEHYSFAPGPDAALADELLDRLLSAIPYPPAEFDRENPLKFWQRTPWTRARHRMDLLYGHTFALSNLSDAVLRHLDDFFGPMSVDTATQVVHFAKYQSITDCSGFNRYVSRARLREYWKFPTFSIHGRENRLADVATVQRMQTIFSDAGCDYRHQVFEKFGHQDCLIGQGTLPIFEKISEFLEGPAREDSPVCGVGADPMLVQAPWSGPVIGLLQGTGTVQALPVSFGTNPGLLPPGLVVVIPLRKTGGGYVPLPIGQPQCRVYPAPHFEQGWGKMALSLGDFSERPHSLLLLLVYDEPPELDNAMFGDDDPSILFSIAENSSWEDALDADGVKGVVEKKYPGRTPALAAAITRCFDAPEASKQFGIVTLPQDPASGRLQLALGSCQYPPGILDQHPGFCSYQHLGDHLADSAQTIRPDLLVLMGDQVYTDATAGVADPVDVNEHFLMPYQFFYRSGKVRKVLRELPAVMAIDDHEIADNWQPLPYPDQDNETALATGLKHYLNFQRGLHQPPNPDGSLYYAFEHNKFHFFVADTRTARQSRTVADFQSQCILGDAQRMALEGWLQAQGGADNTRPKFLVCPSMFAPRTRRTLQRFLHPVRPGPTHDAASALHGDNWDGYPASFEYLLQCIASYNVQNLVMLSGDAHLSCIATLLPHSKAAPSPLWSLHSSPLYAPYPFANGQPEELKVRETITIPGNQITPNVTWEVTTDFAAAGDGFAVLQVEEVGGDWRISVRFDREGCLSSPFVLK